jgi:hypothetical protein
MYRYLLGNGLDVTAEKSRVGNDGVLSQSLNTCP